MGVAFHFSHRGYFAEVAEVSVDASKQRESQQGVGRRRYRQPGHQPASRGIEVQGSVIDGMSHLMSFEITIANGRAMQKNFDEHVPLRMRQAPRESKLTS